MEAKARPKPAEKEEVKKEEAPTAEVVAEIINVDGDDEKRSPKRGAILTKNRWGKLKEEKKKRDMAKAPWTKTGRKETTTAQWLERDKDKTEAAEREEDRAYEPCGSNDVPPKTKEAAEETNGVKTQEPGEVKENSWIKDERKIKEADDRWIEGREKD